MQRFQFRLERLLKLKQQREWMGELRRQKARLALEAAQERVRGLNEELAAIAERLRGGRVAADQWPAAYARAGQLGRDLVAAEAEAAKGAQRLNEATTERVRLAQEVETLLHLRDRAWQEHKDAAASAEQQRLDEQSMRRWQAASTDRFRAPPAPGGEEP